MGGQPSAKAHDSSMGLNRNIYSVHYTQMGFPILNQGRASGVSDSGKVGLFPFGGGCHSVSLNHNSPHIPTPNHHNAQDCNKRGRGKDTREHRPSKTKRPVRGCQIKSGWVKRARLAPQSTASAPKGPVSGQVCRGSLLPPPGDQPGSPQSSGDSPEGEEMRAGARCPG